MQKKAKIFVCLKNTYTFILTNEFLIKLQTMKTQNEILLDLAQSQSNLHYMQLLLTNLTINDVSIMFFTRDTSGTRQFHTLRQENFEMRLSYELTQLLNANVELLEQKINDLKTHLKFAK